MAEWSNEQATLEAIARAGSSAPAPRSRATPRTRTFDEFALLAATRPIDAAI